MEIEYKVSGHIIGHINKHKLIEKLKIFINTGKKILSSIKSVFFTIVKHFSEFMSSVMKPKTIFF